jgi:hypothetical protein
LGFFFAARRRAVESEPSLMTGRPSRWPGLPPIQSARSPATKFITPVRLIWRFAERIHSKKDMARTGTASLDP